MAASHRVAVSVRGEIDLGHRLRRLVLRPAGRVGTGRGVVCSLEARQDRHRPTGLIQLCASPLRSRCLLLHFLQAPTQLCDFPGERVALDNGIYLDDPPEAQFGKLMRIPDEVLGEYLRLTTDLDPAEADRLADKAAAGGAGARDVKRRLAREVVTLYHGPEAATAAEAAFDAGVRQRAGAGGDSGPATPLPIPEAAVRDGRVWVIALLADAGLVVSRGEAEAAGQPGRDPARRPAGRLDRADLDPRGAGRAPADRRPPVPGPPPGTVSVLTGRGIPAGRRPLEGLRPLDPL